ncbi:MAG: tryptophan--tRNA ligase [bacterium]
MTKKRVLSGMRPTGKLHLGHLLGALSNWKKFQEEYDCYYMVADLHALTTAYLDTAHLKEDIKDMVIDWLSVGLDPERCVIFRQSEIPHHTELHFFLSCLTPLPWLERCPTYKEQQNELKHLDLHTYGFLGYPLLQTADIILYKAQLVPVGVDQLPHLELSREITRRFNNFYGEVFPLPESKLTEVPKLPGLDGRKMSKSYHNCIYLSDSEEEIKRKVRQVITDPARIHPTDLGHPEVCNLFTFHQAFNQAAVSQVEEECRTGKRGCVACKKELARALIESLSEIHTRRRELLEEPERIWHILERGRQKAQQAASATMEEVRKAMRF